MKKLVIIGVDNYDFELIDAEGNIYHKNIEFICEDTPKEKDILFIHNQLLNEDLLTFGSVDSKYGKTITSNDIDIIIWKRNNKKVFLKRIYG